uniref:Degenerin mec-10 n=1 Tax=Lygus hesperus TaxID=30085 RepID=A0A0A9W4B4_LYGHE
MRNEVFSYFPWTFESNGKKARVTSEFTGDVLCCLDVFVDTKVASEYPVEHREEIVTRTMCTTCVQDLLSSKIIQTSQLTRPSGLHCRFHEDSSGSYEFPGSNLDSYNKLFGPDMGDRLIQRLNTMSRSIE